MAAAWAVEAWAEEAQEVVVSVAEAAGEVVRATVVRVVVKGVVARAAVVRVEARAAARAAVVRVAPKAAMEVMAEVALAAASSRGG